MAPTRSSAPANEATMTPEPILTTDELAALQAIEKRMLWISTMMIHHANNVRPSLEKSKVGGHQASSASVVDDHDCALFPLSAGRRPGFDQTACVPDLPCSPVFARSAGSQLPDHAARIQRVAGVPKPNQGSRPGRLLDGFRRAWSGGAEFCRPCPHVRARSTSVR